MCDGREGRARNRVSASSNMYSWRPWSEPRQAISPGDLVPPQNSVPLGPSPAVVAKMAADVKASLCAYPVTVFPEIAHLSPDAVTASVDSLCGEALTGSPAVSIGGCGQNLLRETARFPGLGCATPTFLRHRRGPFPRSRTRRRADFAAARRGITSSQACFLAHRHDAAHWCALYRKSAGFDAFPAHGRNENRCSMSPWDCSIGARLYPRPHLSVRVTNRSTTPTSRVIRRS